MNGLARRIGLVALGLVVGGATTAQAAPLDPLAFQPQGDFPTTPGQYTINTSGIPTLSGPGGSIAGVVSNGIAVFDFSAINVGASENIIATGALPLALLSQSGIVVSGTIDVSGSSGQSGILAVVSGTINVSGSSGGPGGPGGGNGGGGTGGGPGGGGAGTVSTAYTGPLNVISTGSGGGGFGGPGGRGAFVPLPIPVGPGGGTYGNLLQQLQGGSGGGGSLGPGGGGGGAIELGAVGPIDIPGTIRANGGSGFAIPFGGGGSGGGILVHSPTVTLTGTLSAAGGPGGPGIGFGSSPTFSSPASGGGGGGRVDILTLPNGFSSTGSINVAGGPPGNPSADSGGPGQVTFSIVPEPASLTLLGIGLLGVVGYARHAGRRVAA